MRMTEQDVEQKDSLCDVLGNIHDINDDQEGQVPSLEMSCSFSEFHYTEQSQSHCAAAAQHWPFRMHHPEEMPISNIYWHGSILMCCCQQPVGECHAAAAEHRGSFSYICFLNDFLSWGNWYSHCLDLSILMRDFTCLANQNIAKPRKK